MAKERPEVLESATYKIRIPDIDAPMYVTIVMDKGKVCELFINSKDMPSYPWVSHLTRTTSVRLREGTDIQCLIDEMKEIYDTDGGYIIPKSGGVHAHSVVYHLGWLLERHVDRAVTTQRGNK